MASKHARRRTSRSRSIESLEERRVMSAEPFADLLGGQIEQHALDDSIGEPPALVQHSERDADFWIDSWSERDPEALLGDIEQTLASAHGSTGLTQVRNDYGFIGTGQTVAIIDSGIAWDHDALGGGYGANYRVVGGWDFTEENDANPFDDGPSGSHGTHVAGIVGSDRAGTNDDGVAPGVDLVGLRVFNDDGAGYFSWVENALRWVHQNRNAYDNPITAVNLSLGTSWNSTSVPSWAMLEDEFAQIKADGIFIAVSAGNSFSTYNATGLSYPAASPYVVPVMSVDDGGNLSAFSQRHPNAIGAPGRYIVSTVPDYVGNQNGVNDDFASYSGTSMAAPYVAGASVILREAMQFVGYTNITQDTIFNHMMSTATTFFDAATSQNYKRLNVGNALNALMPGDDYGSTVATAYNLGTLSGTSEIDGLIGKLSDADYFSFTAAATGTVSFTATTTHGLSPVWTASAVAGEVSGANGETFTLDVVAGQSYTLGLSTSGGIGYYDLAIETEASFTYVDWGVISQERVDHLNNSGESWYRLEAGRSGYLTAQAFFTAAGGNIDLALFDGNLQLAATGAAAASGGRVDVLANVGSEYFLRVAGTNADVSFQLTNLVSRSGTTVNVVGTSTADTISVTAGPTHQVSLNGVTYSFGSDVVNTINLDGGGGYDAIRLTGTSGNETAILRVGSAVFSGTGFSVSAINSESVSVYSGGGSDRVDFHDSAGDDRFRARAHLNDAYMSGDGYVHYSQGFSRANAFATAGGNDRADFYDSAGDDRFIARAHFDDAYMFGTGYVHYSQGFSRANAFSTAGGNDRADFYDGAGDDRFIARAHLDDAYMCGDGYVHYSQGFSRVNAFATAGGNDRADFYDSAGDDRFIARAHLDDAYMYGDGYVHYSQGFSRVNAFATAGGNDRADFYDGAGDDRFIARAEWKDAYMSGVGYVHYSQGFSRANAFATAGGNDRADFYDSSGDDRFIARAYLDDAYMCGTGYVHYSQGFSRVNAFATAGGIDRADFYDSAGDDRFIARAEWNDAYMHGNGYINYTRGFGSVTARSQHGGTDEAIFEELGMGDTIIGRGNYVRKSGVFATVYGEGFDTVIARALQDETPTADVESVDYLFEQVGVWS
ncbi:MAG: S8 family serine peptidase [Pirellulales bacterium]